MPVTEFALGLVAAALLGTGFVLQQDVAQRAPAAHFLRLRLVGDLLRRPRWLAGVAAMAAGDVLSAWVVGHIALSLAEPLLATSLLFALLLAGPLSRQRLHKPEVAGALILIGGVTALSLARSVHSAQVHLGSPDDWPIAGVAIALLALGVAELGRRRSGDQRATLTGISAGLVFGIADALARRTVQILDAGHLARLLTSWPAYTLIAVTLVGLWLMESAFSAAPLRTSLPGITAAEPVAGIVLGIVVFRDSLLVSAGFVAVEAAGLVALLLGVIMVARAPALSRLRRHPGTAGRPGSAAASDLQPAPEPPGTDSADIEIAHTQNPESGRKEVAMDASSSPARPSIARQPTPDDTAPGPDPARPWDQEEADPDKGVAETAAAVIDRLREVACSYDHDCPQPQ